MPLSAIVKNNYRRAKCCVTCRREKGLFCRLLGIMVRPDMVCDRHDDDLVRASRMTECGECAFGPAGDHSCQTGCARASKTAGCYAGRKAGGAASGKTTGNVAR